MSVMTYLSPTMMCRLEAEVRDLQAAVQRQCRTRYKQIIITASLLS